LTPAELLTRVSQLAQSAGMPFVFIVHDTVAGRAKLIASPGALAQFRPFLLKQLGVAEPSEEIPEVGWDDRDR